MKRSISLLWFIVGLIMIFTSCDFFYYRELNSIKQELEQNDKIEIINFYGNEDVTFEEISVNLNVKNKGTLSIYGLSTDVNDFPQNVYIREIGGYSFVKIYCNGGLGSLLNIGAKSDFGKKSNLKFENVSDIVNHYDDILKYVKLFKVFPEYNKYEDLKHDEAILFINKNQNMNYENLVKFYNVKCIADLQIKVANKNCR